MRNESKRQLASTTVLVAITVMLLSGVAVADEGGQVGEGAIRQ